MDHDVADAGSSVCVVCGGVVPVTAGRGRRREYCGRGCQSRAYRRRQRDEQAAMLARAAGRPGGRPVVMDDGEEELATPAGQLLGLAETVAVVMRAFLTDLDEGREPDAALADLRGRLPSLVAKAGALAGQIAHDHRTAAASETDAAGDVDGDAAAARTESTQEMVEAHATALALYDLAGMPYLRSATPEVTAEVVEPVVPVRELGVPDQVLPLVADGLEAGWMLAGWERDPTVFWVLGPGRFRARVEQVGRRWVTVHPMGYLRELRGSGPLVWSGSAQEAALCAARWWRELEEPVRDVLKERFARR